MCIHIRCIPGCISIHIRNVAYNLVNINCAEKNSFSLLSWFSFLVISVTMLPCCYKTHKPVSPNPLPVLNWIVIEWNLGTKKKSRWRLWDCLDFYLWICLKLQDCIGLLGYNVEFKCDKVGCKENVILSTKKEFRDVGSNAAPWEVCWFVATLSTF